MGKKLIRERGSILRDERPFEVDREREREDEESEFASDMERESRLESNFGWNSDEGERELGQGTDLERVLDLLKA